MNNQADKSKKPQRANKNPNDFIRYSGMATKMAIVILAGVLGGQELDDRFNTKSPWFTLGFALLSVGVAIYIVIKDTSK